MTWTAYILQTNLCLILFYLFYYLFLRNETFFRQNRFYLVGASLISFLVPVFQFASVRSLFITQKTYQAVASLDLTYFGTSAEGNTTSSPVDWLLVLYLAGVSVFLCRFLSRLYLTIASGDQATQPYSFFSKVKVPAEIEGRESIHLHETIHVQQWHSADVILFELIAVLNWFNPCAYFIKKEIRHIHEFIADEAAASSQNSKSEYALLLLSNAFGVPPSRLANSFFNDSLIKRRLSMLQKNRSNRTGLLKYGLSAPLFLAMIIFSSATMDQDKALRTIQTELGNLEQLPSAGRAGERSHRADATKSQQKPLQNFQEFYKYTARNVVYPASARASKTEGDVTGSTACARQREKRDRSKTMSTTSQV